MATRVPNFHPTLSVLRDAINALKLQIGAGAFFHLDVFETTITIANASDLATSVALAEQIRVVYLKHLENTSEGGVLAHKVADPAPALVAATDLATGITLANAIKADYNVHRASTTYHYNADATNVVASADATDQSSLNTLLNEIKTDLNAHMISGPTAASIRLVAM